MKKQIGACIVPVGALPLEDQTNFISWIQRNIGINLFEADSLAQRYSAMCVAGRTQEPLVYIPIQPVFVWDGIASKPGITAREEAMCLFRICQAVEDAMEIAGVGESWFVCADDRVADIAYRHGFEEVKGVRLLRLKKGQLGHRRTDGSDSAE